jgi:protein SCO1/2
MTPGQSSRFGKDLLGSGRLHSLDGAGADEVPVIGDGVFGGSPGDPSGPGDGLPVDSEGVSPEMSGPLDDGTGHDPLDVDFPGAAGVGDGDPAGVFDPVGVDSVDDVGPDDAGSLLELRRETRRDEESEHSEKGQSAHDADSTGGLPRVFKWLLGIGGLVVVGVFAFAVFEPVQVLPRVRVAPGFSFVDQGGRTLTSEDGRGAVTLYTFAPVDCGVECDDVAATMREVGRRVDTSVDLGDTEFRMVTIALDSDDPAELASAAASSGADGESWIWAGGDQTITRDVVGGGFGVYYDTTGSSTDFDPVFVIVDGAGLIRGEYRYATLASDADRLTRHISLLGEELRNSKGAGSLVYEAAHILLCYP